MFWRRRKEREQDLERELRSHLEAETSEQHEGGLSPEEASCAARRAFGNTTLVKEEVRDMWRWTSVDQFGQDLHYGLRMMAKNPGFALVAVLTLALGIGANTAIFSVVNGVLLNPLPYAQPDQLVALYTASADDPRGSTSYLNFLDWLRDNHSFSAVAAYRPDSFSLTGLVESERIPAEMVSASFFPLLGVQPLLGRSFVPAEDQLGASPVAMISSGFWKRKFGSWPDVLGKPLTLNGIAYTIVGVVPANFRYSARNFLPSDVYVPIGQLNIPGFHDRKISNGMDAVGRLKAGVTFARANADMQALARHLAEEFPEADKGTSITLVPLKQDVVGWIEPLLLMLLAAVVFVLLIACVNVANLMLARCRGRTREVAIRTALGASRSRIVRQLLTESVLLALTGGSLGCLIALWGTRAGLSMLPEVLPRAEEVQVDWRVLLVMAAVSVLAGFFSGWRRQSGPRAPTFTKHLKKEDAVLAACGIGRRAFS